MLEDNQEVLRMFKTRDTISALLLHLRLDQRARYAVQVGLGTNLWSLREVSERLIHNITTLGAHKSRMRKMFSKLMMDL